MYSSALTITLDDLLGILHALRSEDRPLETPDFAISCNDFLVVTLPHSNELRRAFFQAAFHAVGEDIATKLAQKSRVYRDGDTMNLNFPGVTLAPAPVDA